MPEKPIRVALTMIVKDNSEADFLDRCLDSFAPYIFGLYVAVTGPSGEHDKIHEIVAKYGGKSISTSPKTHPEIYSKIDDKWIFSSFAAARNVSFEMVDEEFDYLTWADVDDILTSGEELLKVAIIAREKKYDSVMFNYLYSVRLAEDGSIEQVLIEHMRERLLKPGKFRWVSRLHEVCVPKDDNFKPRHTMYTFSPKKNQLCTWVHLTTHERTAATMERNATILKIQLDEEQGKDPRTKFYLAKTYFDLNTPESLKESAKLLGEYMTQSGWDAERANAQEYLGLIHMKLGDLTKAIDVFHNSIIEYPKHHLAILRLADCYYRVENVDFGDHWLDVAMKMDLPEAHATIGNTYEIRLIAASLMYKKAYREQNMNDMTHWAKVRVELMGKDDGLYENVLAHKYLNDAALNVFNLAKWLKANEHTKTIEKILDILPPELTNQPYAAFIANNILPARKWGKKEIAYYAVAGIEEWTSENLETTGLGGSESAVARLAREWVKLGYKVTVYNDCGSKAGTYDGVTYKPHFTMNWKDKFNVLIIWRNPALLDRDIEAKTLCVDLHDIASPLDWSEERVNKVDKVFFKSNWHRQNLPNIPDNKAVVVGNGIVVEDKK